MESPGPPPAPDGMACADCGGIREPKALRCRRCARSRQAAKRQRARVLLLHYKPKEVAEMLGIGVATVYRARKES